MEDQLAHCHREKVLGRPVRTLRDEIEVAQRLGQPLLRVTIGLQNHPVMVAATSANAPEALKPMADAEEGPAEGMASANRPWVAETGTGAIQTEADIETFPWPHPDQFNYRILDEADRILPDSFKLIAAVGKVFNLAWWMMGFEQYSLALYDQPAMIGELYRRIGEIQIGIVERIIEHRCVGAVRHADDMAYKTALMVSPQVLRQHIFPVYQKMNRECQLRGLPVIFHSDGKMDDMMKDIIDVGFAAFNPIEPGPMDIRALKRDVAGRLTLIGNVDLSYTLTRGTPAEVDAEVYDLIRDLAPGGGYALASANSIPDYVPWRNFVALHKAWLKYGRYPIRVA
jgi:uroporphyrinogen decarboxylase